MMTWLPAQLPWLGVVETSVALPGSQLRNPALRSVRRPVFTTVAV